MTSINQKVFSRAFGCCWDCGNQRIDGAMTKWSLWQNTSGRERRNWAERIRNFENKWRKMKIIWATWLIYTTNCREKSSGQEILRGRWYYDLAKWLSHYLYFFSFSFLIWTYYTRKECRKVSHDHDYITWHMSAWHHMMHGLPPSPMLI